MAHNARIRTFGFWTDTTPVTAAEYEALDQAQFEAINGDLGGTWAPSAPIIIGGAGVEIGGAGLTTTTINGAWTCDSTPEAVGWKATNIDPNDGFIFDAAKTFNAFLPPVIVQSPNNDWWRYLGDVLVQHDVSIARLAYWPIRPIIGCTIVSIAVYLQAMGTRTDLPTTVPRLLLRRRNIVTGTTEFVGAGVSDTSADVAAYQSCHSITITPAHTVPGGAYQYYLSLFGESGTYSVADTLQVYGAVVFFTLDHLTAHF